ncbi:MAG: BamA/TamA family outer membrane protein [Bacteroidetes bacterium]|nr:BamA/TamA family outer membrane protein [Bacteroidota bacterium]
MKKPKSKVLQNAAKRFGEPPVLHDSTNVPMNTDYLLRAIHTEGYLDASITSSTQKSPKGIQEIYKIDKGEPYKIGKWNHLILSEDPNFQRDFQKIMQQNSSTFPKEGAIFRASTLGNMRNKISQDYRNLGYFRFSTDFLEFEADSGRIPHTVDLTLKILKPEQAFYHKPYRYRHWKLYVGNTPPSSNEPNFLPVADTLPWLRYLNADEAVDQSLLISQIDQPNNPIFSEGQLRKTLANFARLGLFAPGNYTIVPNDSSGELDLLLVLKTLPKWQFRTEYEFSTNNISLFGLNGNISFTRRNALRIGDQLEFRANVGAESQQLTGSFAKSSGFNTLDLGLRATISVPGIVRPGWFSNWKLNGEERTLVSLIYQSQQRQDFDRNVLKTGLGVSGLVHGRTQYQIWPMELTYANTGFTSDALKKILEEGDPLLRANFVSYFSTGVRGSWIQDRIRESKRDYLGLNLESSGNFYALIKASSKSQNLNDTIWGLPYFRFLKLDIEWRKHLVGKGESLLASRALGSFGLPFGDQKTLPLEKRTFGGGTNSLRAWPIRGLGPGSLSNYANGRLIQFGEIRLEANLEWRFKVVGPLKAALFMDAGNIWTLNDTAYNGLGNFTGKRFINEIALNQGLGLRYDFGFFVMRVDFALKVRDPALAHGKRWVIGNWFDPDWRNDQWRFEVQGDQPSLNQNGVSPVYPLFSTVFGINYPF